MQIITTIPVTDVFFILMVSKLIPSKRHPEQGFYSRYYILLNLLCSHLIKLEACNLFILIGMKLERAPEFSYKKI